MRAIDPGCDSGVCTLTKRHDGVFNAASLAAFNAALDEVVAQADAECCC